LEELTIRTLVDWHQARDLAVPEMSFVIHDRETADETAPGRQMLHSHVFTAGTIPTLDGRESVMVKERDVVRNKGGMERDTNLNRIAEQNWPELLDRTIGPDWQLTRERAIEQELQPELQPEPEPEDIHVDAESRRASHLEIDL